MLEASGLKLIAATVIQDELRKVLSSSHAYIVYRWDILVPWWLKFDDNIYWKI